VDRKQSVDEVEQIGHATLAFGLVRGRPAAEVSMSMSGSEPGRLDAATVGEIARLMEERIRAVEIY